jgi:hypothetical protein
MSPRRSRCTVATLQPNVSATSGAVNQSRDASGGSARRARVRVVLLLPFNWSSVMPCSILLRFQTFPAFSFLHVAMDTRTSETIVTLDRGMRYLLRIA